MGKLTLEERLERLEAAHEVANVIGRYAFYMNGQQWQRVPELFAQKVPGVTCEVTSNGVYTGIEQIRKLWIGFLAAPRVLPDGPSPEAKELYAKEKNRVGRLTVHEMTTPVIEVAQDGKTAKGVWMSPGRSAMRDEAGNLQAYWVFGKCQAEFIREDGEWKFWHLHPYITLRTKYEESWVKSAEKGKVWYPSASQHLEARTKYPPDAPTTYHKMYDPEGVLEMVPAPPEPYDTYRDK